MKNFRCRIFQTLCIGILLFPVLGFSEESAYDPLVPVVQEDPGLFDLTVADTNRDRDIPVRIYLPPGKKAFPVVLFSHGLGGSREGNPYLGKHWAGRGYVSVFLQHIGSDTSVWEGTPSLGRLSVMREAANAGNFLLRVKDVSAVIDQLERWNEMDGHALNGRLDLEQIGMSGHSFGAVTTQAVSGQRTERGRMDFSDSRIDAAVVMSPSSPDRGTAEAAFGQVTLPWLLMTGTQDIAIIGNADMKSRLAVFPALPPGDKYELVLNNAEHSAFGDRALPGDKETRNPNHHRVILALSTAFWDAYLRKDSLAKKWLDGDGPKTLLEKEDRWRRK